MPNFSIPRKVPYILPFDPLLTRPVGPLDAESNEVNLGGGSPKLWSSGRHSSVQFDHLNVRLHRSTPADCTGPLTPGRVFRSARWSASALWAHGRVFTDKGRAVDERLPTGLSASIYSFGILSQRRTHARATHVACKSSFIFKLGLASLSICRSQRLIDCYLGPDSNVDHPLHGLLHSTNLISESRYTCT
jgi:hypothetical protein